MASYLDSPLYQQMLASVLQQSGPDRQYPGQAAANAGAQIAHAFAIKGLMDQAQTRQNAAGQAFADALSPIANGSSMGFAGGATPQMPSPAATVTAPAVGALPGGAPMPAQTAQLPGNGTPPPQVVNTPNAPIQPSAQQVMARLLQSGNPDVQNQITPLMAHGVIQQAFQKQDPFTLGPDQNRYDANGNLIAKGSAKAQAHILSAQEAQMQGLPVPPAGSFYQTDETGKVSLTKTQPDDTGTWSMIGTDATGKPIFFNSKTRQQMTGGNVIGPKPTSAPTYTSPKPWTNYGGAP